MRVNAQPYTVIGVLPASYRHVEEDPDRSADVFLPFGFDPAAANRGGHFIRGVGRLAPTATLDQARADLTAIAARLEQEFPTSNHGQTVRVTPLLESMVAGRAAQPAGARSGRRRRAAHRLRQPGQPAAGRRRRRGSASSRCGRRSEPAGGG